MWLYMLRALLTVALPAVRLAALAVGPVAVPPLLHGGSARRKAEVPRVALMAIQDVSSSDSLLSGLRTQNSTVDVSEAAESLFERKKRLESVGERATRCEAPASHRGEGKAEAVTVEQTDEEAKLDARLYALNKLIIDSVKGAIDVVYEGRDYARFYVLETVARVPYFAYLSVLHLRETLGARDPTLRHRMRVHYAEADNELHHLLIMESLGGNHSGVDRAVAQTMAFAYYWYVVAVYSLSEQAAYHLSELIEHHAYHTYDSFIQRNEEELKEMSVPEIARLYYEEENPFLFDLNCNAQACSADEAPAAGTARAPARRRKRLESLYDVFCNIRDDEKEHWETLCNLVQTNQLTEGQGERIEATKPAHNGRWV